MKRHELSGVPGLLSADQLQASVQALVDTQQPSGTIPWPDGHTDAWDHVECAMALTLGGRHDEALKAYEWLRKTQAVDGSWATEYDQYEILDPKIDINQCAYISVGVWQWLAVTGDRQLVDQMWPYVRRALDFVLDFQSPAGFIFWSRDPDGSIPQETLLTGSSSMYQAFRCGIALGELLGEPQPEWELAAGLLQHSIACHPEVYEDKSEFSMDWYYPVLGGAVRGEAAEALIGRRWNEFVVPGLGIRCVNNRPWVTGAETAELALSLMTMGHPQRAQSLLVDAQHLRHHDGSYWTGLVYDTNSRWPSERSSWTAAAMVLSCDALAGGPTLELFSGHNLPTGVLLPDEVCSQEGAHCSMAFSER